MTIATCKTIFFNSDWLGKTGHLRVVAVRWFRSDDLALMELRGGTDEGDKR